MGRVEGRGIPARFFCTLCVDGGSNYLLTVSLDALRAWAEQEDRQDVTSMLQEGVPDFFRCRCEIDAAERSKSLADAQAQRVRTASLPARNDKRGPRTFDNFEVVEGSEVSYDAARQFGQQDESVLELIGVRGCGKSHLLEAAGRALVAAGVDVRYEVTENMLERLRASRSPNSDEELYRLMSWYSEIDVLLLDELARDPATQRGVAWLEAIIDARIVNTRLTLIATNVNTAKKMIAKGWGDSLASRLFDTNTGAIKIVWSKAVDYRAS